jgi:TRAP transporter TAXI family solute receptor
MRITRTLAALALATAAVGAHAGQQFINIVTGGTSGVYYPLGVAMSQVFSTDIPNVKTSVQATKGSAENANLLQAGRGELGFGLADAIADAWAGDAEAGFKAPLDKLRGVAAIYPNYIQLVASADSGIKTLADLKGKRISVGAPKSGTELNARAILKAAGYDYRDFSKVEYLPFAESVELMKNRQLDATLLSAGLGVAAIRDLSTSIKVVFVPVPADVVAKVGNVAYQPGNIPANTYQGQAAEVPTVTIRNVLVTHADVPADVVYAMTKALFANLEHLKNAHSAAKAISLEAAPLGLPVPLHPGAARFFAEAGAQAKASR